MFSRRRKGRRIRINTGLKNMHLFCIYRGVKGYVRLYKEVQKSKMITEEAKKKAKVVEFFKKYGVEAAVEAFGYKKSTVYEWEKKIRESGGSLQVLNPRSRAPKNKRKKKWDDRIVQFIKELREEYGDLGEKKIESLLFKYCINNNLNTISASTIGRIIKEKNLYFHKEYTHFGKIKKIKYKKKQRRCGYIPKNPGDLLQIDNISIFEQNVKRYIYTAVDLKSRFAFAYSYKSLSSKTAEDFVKKLQYVVPFKIKRIQTDNGSEFHKHFDDYLVKNKISHFYNYPKHPQHNACVERLNKTIQDEFLNSNLYLTSDVNLLNYNLINYLMFYNKDRPHKSLNYRSPANYLIDDLHFSNMLWGSANP